MTTPETGFSLLDEPWIVALEASGREIELSILDVLDQADDLVTLGGEVPTQGFAITRLLLAFLHRAVDGPDDADDWAGLWNAPGLPTDAIRSYAERFRHRFDLFDSTAPFFQVPDLRKARDEVSSLAKIVADVPNGELLFTTRSARSLQSMTPAEAARWLIHAHAYDTAGIKSGVVGGPKTGARSFGSVPGWSGQIGGILVQGRTLRETLLLNLVARDFASIGGPDDLPPWERDIDSARYDEAGLPTGAIALYTWQTRRIRLHGDRDGVTGVVLAKGDMIEPQNLHAFDPHTAWRHDAPQSKKLGQVTYMPRTHAPQRCLWQGLAALLPSLSARAGAAQGPAPYLAPVVLQWVADLGRQGHLVGDFAIRTRGIGVSYGSKNATIAEIVDDTLTLAVALLSMVDPALGQLAIAAVEDAERIAASVAHLADDIAQAAGSAPRSGAGDRYREQFYSDVDAAYRRWLAQLGPATDRMAARTEWQSTILRAVRPVAADIVSCAGPAAWVGRRLHGKFVNVACAEARFGRQVRQLLPLALQARPPIQPPHDKLGQVQETTA
ncbi:type I-E CRISPR-associated protein Cse1/CasA [Kribbella sp. NPDC059898]|uniref:type I-E CRISPR-associated protein Cse1/CasA n=1 Tax=Kribbella sp. NPDC059898 TaxID=3346995 RepID=UPI003662E503